MPGPNQPNQGQQHHQQQQQNNEISELRGKLAEANRKLAEYEKNTEAPDTRDTAVRAKPTHIPPALTFPFYFDGEEHSEWKQTIAIGIAAILGGKSNINEVKRGLQTKFQEMPPALQEEIKKSPHMGRLKNIVESIAMDMPAITSK